MEAPRLRVRHQLPHRLRIDFGERLSPEQMRSVIWLLEHQHPEAIVRAAASGHGLVIVSRSADQPLQDPLPKLAAVLAQPIAHLPEPPPSSWQLLRRRSHQRTLRVLMALAIAGWALPILPGTPFFLLAWWMGWRPEPQPAAATPAPSGSEPPGDGDPSTPRRRHQPKSITNQGLSSRADRHVS